MSEIVKVDGKWNLTKEKAIELGFKSLPQLVKHFKKEYIVPYLSAQIDKNKLTGKDRSLARKGFGEIWVDGKRKYISNVTSYFDNRSSNVGFTDKTKSQARQEVRDENKYIFDEPINHKTIRGSFLCIEASTLKDIGGFEVAKCPYEHLDKSQGWGNISLNMFGYKVSKLFGNDSITYLSDEYANSDYIFEYTRGE